MFWLEEEYGKLVLITDMEQGMELEASYVSMRDLKELAEVAK